ncbi:MAG: hypothetical protein AMJ59_07520 [Gammaproteobacteria bacterium SG8_31]|jgi:hypothetical protein|nr:MAG: hypothetical protein AMJ59_07520 [Gammaproteobacteria bacterium SG8_31]
MNFRFPIALGMILLSFRALAAGADLNVSDDAARLTLQFPLPSNNILIDGSWLHHTDKGETLSVGGYLTGSAAGGNRPLTAGLGTRFYYTGYDKGSKEDGSSLTLGGFVRYQFPQLDRVAVGGTLFYGPSVLSFGDADEFYELEGWAGYSVLRDGEVYVGWRRIKTDFDNDGDTMIDTGFHVGLRVRF